MKKFILLTFLGFILSQFLLAQNNKSTLSEKQRMDFDRHFFGGMKFKMIRNFEDAESEFKNAEIIDPSNADVHYQLATVLLSVKRNSEALFEAERAFKCNPKNEWYAKLLIELYKNEREYASAAKVCRTAWKASSDVHFLYEESGMYVLLGKSSKAISALNEIEKHKGVSEQVSRQKEMIFLNTGNISGAIKEIEKLSLAFPDNIQFKGLLADLYMGKGRDAEGLSIYDAIQRQDPKNGLAAFSLADYYKQKKDMGRFFTQLKLGMESSVEPKIKMQVLGKLVPSGVFGEQHKEKCKELTELFANSNPTASEPWIVKGDILLQERKMEEARLAYLQAIERDYSAFVAWEQILFCDQDLGRFDYMMTDCERIISLFPTYGSAYLMYGLAAKSLKKYPEGITVTREGLSYASSELELIQLLGSLADLAHYGGDYNLCDSSFEAILSLDPKNSFALNNYAYFLSLRTGSDLDKAENMSRFSIELDPQNPSNLDTYGWILFQKKKYLEAKEYIEKSLAIIPTNAEVLEHLGDVLFKLNNIEMAVNKWESALKLSPDNSTLKLKIQQRALPHP
jgi:tetratricopeptide (TPR) repeat protein